MNDVVSESIYFVCGSIQLEQPEYSKNDQNTTIRLSDKEENHFSLCITRNENYSTWEHKCFEQFKTFMLAKRQIALWVKCINNTHVYGMWVR